MYIFKAYLAIRIYKQEPQDVSSHLIDQVLVGGGVAVGVAARVAGALAAACAAEVATAQAVVFGLKRVDEVLGDGPVQARVRSRHVFLRHLTFPRLGLRSGTSGGGFTFPFLALGLGFGAVLLVDPVDL